MHPGNKDNCATQLDKQNAKNLPYEALSYAFIRQAMEVLLVHKFWSLVHINWLTAHYKNYKIKLKLLIKMKLVLLVDLQQNLFAVIYKEKLVDNFLL